MAHDNEKIHCAHAKMKHFVVNCFITQNKEREETNERTIKVTAEVKTGSTQSHLMNPVMFILCKYQAFNPRGNTKKLLQIKKIGKK